MGLAFFCFMNPKIGKVNTMASKKSKKITILSKPVETKPINISDIVAEVDIQSRTALNSRLIEEYSEDLGLGALFPPVEVFYDGTYYFLTDGFHRFNAHKQSGKKTIAANIHKGAAGIPFFFGWSQRDSWPQTIKRGQKKSGVETPQ